MRSYKEILRFLIIREQLSLGWKIAFFVVCGALLYGSLVIRQMSIQTTEVSGTVLENSNEAKADAPTAYLTVRLADGHTVQASVNGKMDYRPGERVVLKETASSFFGGRKYEMNYPAASCGVSKAHHANAFPSVTPEFFSPGSRSGLAWIPA